MLVNIMLFIFLLARIVRSLAKNDIWALWFATLFWLFDRHIVNVRVCSSRVLCLVRKTNTVWPLALVRPAAFYNTFSISLNIFIWPSPSHSEITQCLNIHICLPLHLQTVRSMPVSRARWPTADSPGLRAPGAGSFGSHRQTAQVGHVALHNSGGSWNSTGTDICNWSLNMLSL